MKREEAVFEVKEKKVRQKPGAMKSLTTFLKRNYYDQLYSNLPGNVQQKLRKVGLSPEDLFKKTRKMAFNVVSKYMNRT